MNHRGDTDRTAHKQVPTRLRVRVLADIPEAERPNVRVIDTRGAWFRAYAADAAKAVGFNVCDLEVPSEVR